MGGGGSQALPNVRGSGARPCAYLGVAPVLPRRDPMTLPRRVLFTAVALDALAVGAAFVGFYAVRFQLGLVASSPERPLGVWRAMAVTQGFWLVLLAAFGFYRARVLREWTRADTWRLARVVLGGFLVLFFLLFFDAEQPGAARLTLPLYGLLVWGAVVGGRALLNGATRTLHRHGVALAPVAVVGDARRTRYVADALRAHPELGYDPVLLLTFEEDGGAGVLHLVEPSRVAAARIGGQKALASSSAPVVASRVVALDRLERDLEEAIRATGVQELVVVVGPREQHLYFRLTHVASDLGIPLRFVSNFRPILGTSDADDTLGTLALPPALLDG